jgi:hypothetical protein
MQMKIRPVAVLGTAAALLLSGTFAATLAQPGSDLPKRQPGDRQPGDRPPRPDWGPGPADRPDRDRDHEDHEEGSFEDHMSGAGLALRGLRRSIGNDLGDGSDAAKMVQELQTELVGAKGAAESAPMSDTARADYGEDRAAFRRDLRLGLIEAIKETLTLEEAILNGDAQGAAASLKELRAVQREHHGLFKPEDEEDEKEESPSRRPRG